MALPVSHSFRNCYVWCRRKRKQILLCFIISLIFYICFRYYNRRIDVQYIMNPVSNEREQHLILDWGSYVEKPEFPSQFMDVGHCKVTQDRTLLHSASSVVIPLRRLIHGYEFPLERMQNQRWIFLLDESPSFTKISQWFDLSQLNGLFNLTMTYRRDSDVPIPYGWTIPRNLPLTTSGADRMFNERPKLVAAAISNCKDKAGRLSFVDSLKRHIQVDVYGLCGSLKCGGRTQDYTERLRDDCPELHQYKFFLALENSHCREYITEKFWSRALQAGLIPIVLGASSSDYRILAPPGSYIHVDDFRSVTELAQHVTRVANDKAEYAKYHEWRKTHDVIVRHQFYNATYIFGKLCEKLMVLDKSGISSSYADISNWWYYPGVCETSRWR